MERVAPNGVSGMKPKPRRVARLAPVIQQARLQHLGTAAHHCRARFGIYAENDDLPRDPYLFSHAGYSGAGNGNLRAERALLSGILHHLSKNLRQPTGLKTPGRRSPTPAPLPAPRSHPSTSLSRFSNRTLVCDKKDKLLSRLSSASADAALMSAGGVA